ncbi:hypothetical protein NQ318_018041 [Aromia moschata]|uniref:Uncharacterized protein n=1 Tax=Aromia moschata TaxID=1265417 RepID=A0AAV8ZCI4_9CUCU|nr:hypothetical protein NQ318_018041 [Aromia moschata]
MLEVNTQYPEKVNVWAGILNSQIIGPYLFDDTLTGARYLDFLQNFLQRLHYCQEATGAQFEHLV